MASSSTGMRGAPAKATPQPAAAASPSPRPASATPPPPAAARSPPSTGATVAGGASVSPSVPARASTSGASSCSGSASSAGRLGVVSGSPAGQDVEQMKLDQLRAADFADDPTLYHYLPQFAQRECRTHLPHSPECVWRVDEPTTTSDERTLTTNQPADAMALNHLIHSTLRASGKALEQHEFEKRTNLHFDLAYFRRLVARSVSDPIFVRECLDYLLSFERVFQRLQGEEFVFEQARFCLLLLHFDGLVKVDVAEKLAWMARKEHTAVTIPAYWPVRARAFMYNAIGPVFDQAAQAIKASGLSPSQRAAGTPTSAVSPMKPLPKAGAAAASPKSPAASAAPKKSTSVSPVGAAAAGASSSSSPPISPSSMGPPAPVSPRTMAMRSYNNRSLAVWKECCAGIKIPEASPPKKSSGAAPASSSKVKVTISQLQQMADRFSSNSRREYAEAVIKGIAKLCERWPTMTSWSAMVVMTPIAADGAPAFTPADLVAFSLDAKGQLVQDARIHAAPTAAAGARLEPPPAPSVVRPLASPTDMADIPPAVATIILSPAPSRGVSKAPTSAPVATSPLPTLATAIPAAAAAVVPLAPSVLPVQMPAPAPAAALPPPAPASSSSSLSAATPTPAAIAATSSPSVAAFSPANSAGKSAPPKEPAADVEMEAAEAIRAPAINQPSTASAKTEPTAAMYDVKPPIASAQPAAPAASSSSPPLARHWGQVILDVSDSDDDAEVSADKQSVGSARDSPDEDDDHEMVDADLPSTNAVGDDMRPGGSASSASAPSFPLSAARHPASPRSHSPGCSHLAKCSAVPICMSTDDLDRNHPVHQDPRGRHRCQRRLKRKSNKATMNHTNHTMWAIEEEGQLPILQPVPTTMQPPPSAFLHLVPPSYASGALARAAFGLPAPEEHKEAVNPAGGRQWDPLGLMNYPMARTGGAPALAISGCEVLKRLPSYWTEKLVHAWVDGKSLSDVLPQTSPKNDFRHFHPILARDWKTPEFAAQIMLRLERINERKKAQQTAPPAPEQPAWPPAAHPVGPPAAALPPTPARLSASAVQPSSTSALAWAPAAATTLPSKPTETMPKPVASMGTPPKPAVTVLPEPAAFRPSTHIPPVIPAAAAAAAPAAAPASVLPVAASSAPVKASAPRMSVVDTFMAASHTAPKVDHPPANRLEVAAQKAAAASVQPTASAQKVPPAHAPTPPVPSSSIAPVPPASRPVPLTPPIRPSVPPTAQPSPTKPVAMTPAAAASPLPRAVAPDSAPTKAAATAPSQSLASTPSKPPSSIAAASSSKAAVPSASSATFAPSPSAPMGHAPPAVAVPAAAATAAAPTASTPSLKNTAGRSANHRPILTLTSSDEDEDGSAMSEDEDEELRPIVPKKTNKRRRTSTPTSDEDAADSAHERRASVSSASSRGSSSGAADSLRKKAKTDSPPSATKKPNKNPYMTLDFLKRLPEISSSSSSSSSSSDDEDAPLCTPTRRPLVAKPTVPRSTGSAASSAPAAAATPHAAAKSTARVAIPTQAARLAAAAATAAAAVASNPSAKAASGEPAKPAKRPAPAAVEQEEPPWSCPYCTLINCVSRSTCEACDNPRPEHT